MCLLLSLGRGFARVLLWSACYTLLPPPHLKLLPLARHQGGAWKGRAEQLALPRYGRYARG